MISEVKLMDCMDYMAGFPDGYFQLAIVDPPYGIDINMNMGRKKGQAKKHAEKEWDGEIPPPSYFTELFRVSKNQIIWGGNYMTEMLKPTKSWIFWDKLVPDGVTFADGELAWTSFDKTLVKAKIPYSGFRGLDNGGKIHPTQKPVALYHWTLKNYAKPGDKILDTHLGSGSSRIAAYDMGFDFYATELDADYFEAQEQRFQRHIKQGQLFVPQQQYGQQISLLDNHEA